MRKTGESVIAISRTVVPFAGRAALLGIREGIGVARYSVDLAAYATVAAREGVGIIARKPVEKVLPLQEEPYVPDRFAA